MRVKVSETEDVKAGDANGNGAFAYPFADYARHGRCRVATALREIRRENRTEAQSTWTEFECFKAMVVNRDMLEYAESPRANSS